MNPRSNVDVEVEYTDAELADIANSMTAAVFEITELEAEKKSWDAIQNGKIKEKQAELEDYAARHRSGQRVLMVPCELNLNFEERQREWVALNDQGPIAAGEIVKVEPLQPDDLQSAIPFPAAPQPEEDDNPFEEEYESAMISEPEDSEEEPEEEVEEVEEEVEEEDPFGELPDDADNPFDVPEFDTPEDAELVVTDQGVAIENIKPPKFTLSEAHLHVLRAAKDAKNSTEVLSFEDESSRIRAAADHLLSMEYIEGEGYSEVIGLTDKGRDLFRAGYAN